MTGYYTINDVAMMSGLSTRTIRNYIKAGILDGEKQDGIWYFTEEDFEAFLRNPAVAPSIRAKRNAVVYDFMLDEKRETDAMCTILDFHASDEEAQEISEFFCGAINAGRYGSDLRFSFGKTEKHVRVILSGSQEGVAALLADYYAG